MSAPARRRMTAEEFFAFALDHPEGERFELVAGELVAMAPERVGHARAKNRVLRALEAGLAARRLPCEALPDGLLVRIDEATVYEPDALVRCGPPLPDEALEATDPVIIVEVVSPSSARLDTGAKLADYFRIASVRHYLIVRTGSRAVIHHARDDAGGIRTRILKGGTLVLDPPGLAVEVESFFG